MSEAERKFLLDLISKGIANARKLKRANILLMADKRIYQDMDIAHALSAGISTLDFGHLSSQRELINQ